MLRVLAARCGVDGFDSILDDEDDEYEAGSDDGTEEAAEQELPLNRTTGNVDRFARSVWVTSMLRVPQIGVRVSATLACLLAGMPASAGGAAADSWYRLSAATWESLAEPRRPVEGAELDVEFLAAAIFHESNRRRVQAGQLRLIDDPRARTAAGRHAATIAATGQVVHRSPLRGETSPRARLEAAGVVPQHIGENLAMTPLRASPDGGEDAAAEETRSADRDSSSGRDAPFRSYGDVAKAIVQQWMDSPRHRALLLSRQVSRIGCAVRFARRPSGLEVVYAVQVVFDPLDPRR